MTEDLRARAQQWLRDCGERGRDEVPLPIDIVRDLLARAEATEAKVEQLTALAMSRARDIAQLEHEAEAAEQQLQLAQKEIAILKLSVPLEDELSSRIDEMCKYLAMEDGFTLNGIARLFIETQRRMAADWSDVGRERRQRQAAEQQLQALHQRVQAVAQSIQAQADIERGSCEYGAELVFKQLKGWAEELASLTQPGAAGQACAYCGRTGVSSRDGHVCSGEQK